MASQGKKCNISGSNEDRSMRFAVFNAKYSVLFNPIKKSCNFLDVLAPDLLKR